MILTLAEAGARFWNSGCGLLIPCQGRTEAGRLHCTGMIRVPFANPPDASRVDGERQYWTVTSGSTLDDLTLSPSINADACGHFNVVNGAIQ